MQMVNKMLSAGGNIIRINFSKKMSIGISVAEICAFVSSLVFGLALYNKWITKLIINPDVLLNGIVYKYGMQWEDSLGRIGLRPVVYMKGLFVLPGFTALITIVLNAAAAALLCRPTTTVRMHICGPAYVRYFLFILPERSPAQDSAYWQQPFLQSPSPCIRHIWELPSQSAFFSLYIWRLLN